MCILLKSPVRSCTVTSVIRPTSLPGSSVGVSPRACLLNISGARRLYHTFAFHLSLILRAAARDFFSAMRAVRKGEAYLRVLGWTGVPRHRTRCRRCKMKTPIGAACTAASAANSAQGGDKHLIGCSLAHVNNSVPRKESRQNIRIDHEVPR